jgi:steroid 5-alpha reductase family enzyme
MFWAVFSTTVGVCLMIGADAQKFIQLKYKKGLVNDGFFALTRNPNYLGEVLIYGGFGVMANDCIAWCILLTVWIVLFGTGMLRKELSFMKKAGWAEYREKSLVFLPRLTPDYLQNYLLYGAAFLVAYLAYLQGGFFRVLGVK